MSALLDFLKSLFVAQSPGNAAVLQGLIQTLTEKVQTMSDNLSTQFDAQDAKVDQLISAVGSLEQRVAANDQKLLTISTERDQLANELGTTKTALDQVRAELAAMPQVDASLGSRLQAESGKLDGVIGRLNAIDAAPAAPAGTTGSDTVGGGASGTDTTGGGTSAPPGPGTAL